MPDTRDTRYRLTQLVLACLLPLVLSHCDARNKPSSVGQTAILGEPDHRWIVVNYWATWCKPCIDEMPELNRFAKANATQVRVYAVNFDELQGQALSDAVQKLNIAFPVLTKDPAMALKYNRPKVLPTTVILTPQWDQHQVLIGPQTHESLESTLKGMKAANNPTSKEDA